MRIYDSISEWVRPNGERIPMHDEDPTFSKIESDNCKRMATLACYKIPDNSMVALIPKQQFNDTKSSLPRHGKLTCNQVMIRIRVGMLNSYLIYGQC